MITLSVVRSWGQVQVHVIMGQEQYLPGEAINLKVRVVNHSGHTLRFGEDNSWLHLSVQESDSSVVARLSEVPVQGEFVLPPSKMATKELNIEPHFALNRPGQFSVSASVHIEEWNQSITSAAEPFNIVSGTRLWEKTFGLASSEPGRAPEVRKYLLQQANYLKAHIRLYARVTDGQEEHTYGVVPIGPMTSFSRPKAVLDRESNLHILYLSGPRIATYCKISPDAEVLEFEKREYSNNRPRLSASEDGTITIQGGVRVSPPPSNAPPATEPESSGAREF